MGSRIFRVACAGLFTIVMVGTALAQTATDIQLTRTELQKDRQKIVAANMDLTEDEGLAFWVMYRDYRLEMAHVGDRLVKLITDYAASLEKLSDEQAVEMMKRWVSIQDDELAVHKKYMKKFTTIIPIKKTFKFFQIENKLDAVIRNEVVAMIPLVR